MLNPLPILSSADAELPRAFRIALGDLAGNLVRFAQGRLDAPRVCLAAGSEYDQPWTRDMSLNTWSGFGLLAPAIARDSLRAVEERDPDGGEGGWRIGGQYWDAVIWAEGAWQLYLATGDRAWLAEAEAVTRASLARFEREEWDEALGLFRGAAFFQDGIAAYPDDYAGVGGSDVRDWVPANPTRRAPAGFGIPWASLSTNALYANAYRRVADMRRELGLPEQPRWRERHAALAASIRRNFWNPRTHRFDYLIAPWGRCDHQETAGHAFLLLFDLVDDEQRAAILGSTVSLPGGVPCVWPTFPRYAAYAPGALGRHSGTVWPQVQGLWAHAALRAGAPKPFFHELRALATHLCRDGQCAEIYHPLTGEIHGGVQEDSADGHLREWRAVPRMAWTATAYLRLVLFGLCGMEPRPGGIAFAPTLAPGMGPLSLEGLPYRGAMLSIRVSGAGSTLRRCLIGGRASEPFLPASAAGDVAVELELG